MVDVHQVLTPPEKPAVLPKSLSFFLVVPLQLTEFRVAWCIGYSVASALSIYTRFLQF